MPMITGAIVMWSGLIGNIPEGWALCDGSNGTINLRDRFIIGAGGTYSVGATGGSANAVVVSHTHSISGSLNTFDPGSHTHRGNLNPGTIEGFGGGAGQGSSSSTVTSSITDNSHGHGISVSTTGESGIDKNLPLYYALAFIQQIV